MESFSLRGRSGHDAIAESRPASRSAPSRNGKMVSSVPSAGTEMDDRPAPPSGTISQVDVEEARLHLRHVLDKADPVQEQQPEHT